MNLLLYEECLYIECISLWHILYKLIEKLLHYPRDFRRFFNSDNNPELGKYGGVHQSFQRQITSYE